MDIVEQVRAKHAMLAEAMARHGLDGVLLSRRCNFSWYTCGEHNHVNTGADVGASSLLVTANKAIVFTSNIEAARLTGEALGDHPIEVSAAPWHDTAAKIEAIRQATAGMRLAADAAVAGIEAQPLPTDFDELRRVLLPEDLDRYRDLGLVVASVVERVAAGVQRGNTELELAGLLGALLMREGCLPWVVLVGADERIERFRHPLPTTKRMRQYGMLVCCAERGGLIAACTRLLHFGKVPAELAEKNRAVATVDAAMIDATRPGATLGNVLDAGIAAYGETGFPDEWRLHHQGGLCGYLPREVIATPGSAMPVRANQAFAWNPSITGAKSEGTILSTPNGPEVITATGAWPTVEVVVNGRSYSRPGMLVL